MLQFGRCWKLSSLLSQQRQIPGSAVTQHPPMPPASPAESRSPANKHHCPWCLTTSVAATNASILDSGTQTLSPLCFLTQPGTSSATLFRSTPKPLWHCAPSSQDEMDGKRDSLWQRQQSSPEVGTGNQSGSFRFRVKAFLHRCVASFLNLDDTTIGYDWVKYEGYMRTSVGL